MSKDSKSSADHSGHRQRLKEQCLETGFDGMSSHQVLELLLFYAMPYKDTNVLAHQLLDHYGSFSAVLNADYKDLLHIPGVGPNTATLLALMPEFFRRYQLDAFGERPCIHNRRDLAEYVQGLFTGKNYEAMYMICMDIQHNVRGTVMINSGTLGEVAVYPRNVVEMALRYQSKFVALAHNHPGGSLQPSAADTKLTDNLSAVLAAIGIELVEHVIVAKDAYYSFAEHGLIQGDYLPAPRR